MLIVKFMKLNKNVYGEAREEKCCNRVGAKVSQTGSQPNGNLTLIYNGKFGSWCVAE